MKLSTIPTAKNIATVLETLDETPSELNRLCASLTSEQIQQPLGEGEWSFHQVLMHMHHCTDVSTPRIHYALMLDNPTIPVVHAERDWGQLMPYQSHSTGELLTLYQFNRQSLMYILTVLEDEQWERPFLKGEARHNPHNVYREARGMALHEFEHIQDLQTKIQQFF